MWRDDCFAFCRNAEDKPGCKVLYDMNSNCEKCNFFKTEEQYWTDRYRAEKSLENKGRVATIRYVKSGQRIVTTRARNV